MEPTATAEAEASTNGKSGAGSGRSIEVHNPATGKLIGTVPAIGPDEVTALVERARRAQPAWEAAGFAERGQGPRLALEGEIKPGGRVPIATRGGLKARGHPVGATGVYQIVEVVQQLRGMAGATQVPGARLGMAQNIGGSGATILTHLLRAN